MTTFILVILKILIIALLMYAIKEHISTLLYSENESNIIHCVAVVIYFFGICVYVGELVFMIFHVRG